MDTSRSRRSYPNLHNLSLAPLSAKYPLDASSPPSPIESASGTQTPRTSYIAQKSAPTTPGILSLSQSRGTSRHAVASRRHAPKSFAYDGYFAPPRDDVRDAGDIPKAKSTNTLHPGVSFQEPAARLEHTRHHARKATAPLPLRTPLHRHHTSEGTDEWLHRAGLVIASETRDARGQGWLVRRESSTSLVSPVEGGAPDSIDARHIARLSGEPADGIDFPTGTLSFSPRISRGPSRISSRVGSRIHSARPSRRGSRVGSRIDLAMSGVPSARASLELGNDHDDDYNHDDDSAIEPDFVEADGDQGPDDEEEVARLARERGFGLGGWVDALIGWTLFSVDEDGEGSDDDDDDEEQSGGEGGPRSRPHLTHDEARLLREVEAKRRKMERESIIAASALRVQEKLERSERSGQRERSEQGEGDERGESGGGERGDGGEVKINVPKPPEGQEAGGWQDAAWLLSVASKALF